MLCDCCGTRWYDLVLLVFRIIKIWSYRFHGWIRALSPRCSVLVPQCDGALLPILDPRGSLPETLEHGDHCGCRRRTANFATAGAIVAPPLRIERGPFLGI